MSKSITNPQDFESILKKIARMINNGFHSNFFYIKNVGFMVQRNISERNEKLIDDDMGFKIAVYSTGYKKAWILDDYTATLEDIIAGAYK